MKLTAPHTERIMNVRKHRFLTFLHTRSTYLIDKKFLARQTDLQLKRIISTLNGKMYDFVYSMQIEKHIGHLSGHTMGGSPGDVSEEPA